MKLPSNPLRGESIAAKVVEIINFMRASRITSVVGGQVRETPNGTVLIFKPGPGGGGSSGPATCPFGELSTNTEDPPVTSIRGGLLVCGDKNYAVPNQNLVLGTPGQWLVEISVAGVTAATDDDGEIFLPGVITATATDPVWANNAYTGTESYTDTTNPTSPAAPTGTIIIPIGLLTIADGAATFVPTGCGTIRVGQCAGILSHTRG